MKSRKKDTTVGEGLFGHRREWDVGALVDDPGL
jgi:hypothetical protein